MEQREVRRNIFNILFEKELIPDLDYNKRVDELIEENNINITKQKFIRDYLEGVISNSDYLTDKISEKLKGWSLNTIGTVEKVVLKMSFYEIIMKKEGHQIVINEALEIIKQYGEAKSKDFINGILATIVEE